MIIDLSQSIEDKMPVHPYDEQVRVYEDKTLDKDGFNNSRLETGMHAGTHIDAPRHFLDRGKRIGDFELEQFIGKGRLLDVRGEGNITLKQEYFQLVQEGDIVLLFTGLGHLFRETSYYENFDNHPLVDTGLAEFFVERKIKMLGMDIPKPDNFPFPIHKLLLSNGILIMENLNNLAKLVGVTSFEVIALPLKIHAEASIVRAVARVR